MGELLKGKVAIVTGAGRGIGKAIAILMAEQGAKVVVNDLGGEVDGTGESKLPAHDVVQQIRNAGGTAIADYHSVSSPEAAESIIQAAVDEFGRLDILVNNAGITRDRMIFNMTDEEWDSVMKVHAYGTFYCTRAACKVMKEQKGGRILNIVSLTALGNIGQSNYGAAKGAILAFTRCIARDMGRYGVTCNAIIPSGKTRLGWSPEIEAAWKKMVEKGMAPPTASLKEGGPPPPEDVAPLIVYLATDATDHINSCLFHIRGGMIHLYSSPVPIKTIWKVGSWTPDELMKIMPTTIAAGLQNPSPPKES